MNLSIDLSQDATRAYLLEVLLTHLGDDARLAVRTTRTGGFLEGSHYHDFAAVLEAIDASPLSMRVKDDARAVYQILAEAEASVHGCEVQETHFHEVGNAEALANVFAVCQAIELIDPDEIHATAVQVGSGSVQCSHGTMDIPAPATRAILERGIPLASPRLEGELCTPTSAALIARFVDVFDDGPDQLR
jgi:pyridinium-3,5-bisthiocarboxylic acid mononucleotide nickel chelatase